jgi:hypothetical protein
MYFTRFAIALGVTSLAACSGDDRLTPNPIAVESFAAEYVGAVCTQAERCQNQAPYLVDQCSSERELLLGDVEQAVVAGRIAYDPHAARRCVDGIAGTDCMADVFSDETLTECFAALTGTVQKGEECYSLFECAAGFCDSASSGQCPSTCPETIDEGQSCALHFGPSCDWRAGLRCSGGVCTTPVGREEPCEDNNGCQSGLVCKATGEDTPNQCTPLHQEKGFCSSDATCAAGLYCNGDDEGGQCEPRIAEGGACGLDLYTIDAALRGVQCADGLVCKGGGITKKGVPVSGQCAPPANEGQSCLAEGPDAQVHNSGCQTGLICPNGTCVLPPSEGPCAQRGVCQYGVAYCDSTQVCTELKQSGEACHLDLECQGGLCVSSVCDDKVKSCSVP